MAFIDEDGFILGRINVIDLAVVLLVLAIGIAGVSLVTGGDDRPTRTVVLEAGEQPDHVIDALEEGEVPTQDVVTVDAIETANGDNLTLTVTLAVEENEEGLPVFARERLYVDRQLRLDLGDVIVEGVVIEIREE